MITLNTPLVLPSPYSETLANTTVATAAVDFHNTQVLLVLVCCNTSDNPAGFAASANLPGKNVSVNWTTGEFRVNGSLIGYLSTDDLSSFVSVLQAFVTGAEALAVGVNVDAPNPDGSRAEVITIPISQGQRVGAITAPPAPNTVLFPGTIA